MGGVRGRFWRWAVMISGRGSNLQALLDEAEWLRPQLVISSRTTVAGVGKARRAGVPVLCIGHKTPNWSLFLSELERHRITDVALLGFMRILPPEVIRSFAGRMYNLHPSLLPDFKGAKGFEESYAAQRSMGATIHGVSEGLDEGPILRQRALRLSSWANHSAGAARMQLAALEQQLVRESLRRLSLGVTLSPS